MQSKIVIKNSLFGLIQQVITLIFSFVTRSLFVRFIGIELLGLNETLLSVVQTLSLTELGISSAIAYRLYAPIVNSDEKKINEIIGVLRVFYRFVGVVIIVASFILLPFLPKILKGIEVTFFVYTYWFIDVLTTASTYILAYEKTLLYADQKNYLIQIVDLATNIIFITLQCFFIVKTHNYLSYLIIKLIKTITNSCAIHLICKKKYPFLKKSRINKQTAKEIFGDARHIFPGQIASYIYGSTDNIVISSFVNTVSVGMLGNYATLSGNLKSLMTGIIYSIAPSIGTFLAGETDLQNTESVFLSFSHLLYLIALATTVPFVALADSFICLWIGNNYLLDFGIVFLLGIEVYIHLVHNSAVVYINAAGMFKEEKKIEILGAFTNVCTSIILVQFIGIKGVLLGTVISQTVFWVGRSYIVYFKFFHFGIKKYLKYWLRNIVYLVVFSLLVLICMHLNSFALCRIKIIDFIAHGCIDEILILLFFFVCFSRMKEQKSLMSFLGKSFSDSSHVEV